MSQPSTQLVVTVLIQALLSEVHRLAHFNKLIRTKLTQYCYSQSIKYSHATYHEQYRLAQSRQDCSEQRQPKALLQDNFFPAAAAIDQPSKQAVKKGQSQQKNEKKKPRNKTQVSLSQISQPKKNKKSEQNSPYQQLILPKPEQQQAILKQLRKQILQQQLRHNQKNKKKEEEPSKKQGNKQGKQQKLGFDYNGQVIKLRTQNKNSLISGGLSGQTLNSINKTKQVHKNVEHTEIQYERKDRKILKLTKNNQIQFTETKTLLSQARATKGAKFIEDGRVLEEKIKVIPIKQLMNTLSSRQLSKQDYKRIKEATGNVAHFDQFSNNSKALNTIVSQFKNEEENPSQLPSGSQSKLSNSILTRRKSTITISDPQLLQNLIAGAQNQPNVTINSNSKKEEKNNSEQKTKFDSNDQYNLAYMKKGGSLENRKKSKSSADLSNLKLPKISTSRQEMPKARQRVKDKEQIVRAIRKTFQQKLRT